MTIDWDALAASLGRAQLAWIEPVNTARRKRGRLAAFGLASLSEVPRVSIDLAPRCNLCTADCAAAIAAERRYYAGFLGGSTAPRLPPQWCAVPSSITLDRYPDFASYAARVRRHSKGGVLRQVRRAREQGFYFRTIFPDLYRRQRYAIDTSKHFRSGLVIASLLRQRPASDYPPGVTAADLAAYLGCTPAEIGDRMVLPVPPPPACPHHWTITWGVFQPEEPEPVADAAVRRERLVGYLSLKRTGNIARTADVMGHGQYLTANIMKLLFHDVMAWLLARADPCVAGLRYLQYGAIEHGNDGLVAWKRSFEFAPLGFAAVSGMPGQ